MLLLRIGPATAGPALSVQAPPVFPGALGARGSGPAYRGAAPASVRNAVRLMYAGAAYALIYAIGFVAVASAYTRNHPVAAAGYRLGTLVTGVVILSVLQAALWLGMARVSRRGRKWARTAGTAMFAVYTIGAFGVLGSPETGFVVTKLLTVVSWLIACGAVAFLWQRDSGAFFKGRR